MTRKIVVLLFLSLNIYGQVKVRGYYRKNGTYVQSHNRSSPDGNPYNNYSYPGNTNPYTGKVASGNSSTYLNNYYNRSSKKSVSTYSNGEHTPQLSNYSISVADRNFTSNDSFKDFVIKSERAYFHDQPSTSTVRKGYLVEGEIASVLDRRNGFVYISFVNQKDQKTIGWVNENDILYNVDDDKKTYTSYTFTIGVDRAYFYDNPSNHSRRKAYLLFGENFVGEESENGFVYTVFTNKKGITTKGWIKENDASKIGLPLIKKNNSTLSKNTSIYTTTNKNIAFTKSNCTLWDNCDYTISKMIRSLSTNQKVIINNVCKEYSYVELDNNVKGWIPTVYLKSN